MDTRAEVRPARLLTVGALVGLVSLLMWAWFRRDGAIVPPAPWLAIALIVFLAAAVLIAVWPVRQYLTGRSDDGYHPLRAARALQFAQAGALTGAASTGWFLGLAVAGIPDLSFQAARANTFVTGIAILASLGLVAAGMWAQSQCRIPEEDDKPPPSGATPA